MPLVNAGSDLLSQYRTPLLLGHRGAKAYAPENTIEAFELALKHGCDGIEFDVRLTADAEAVVCHDPKFKGVDIAGAQASALVSSGVPALRTILERFANRAFLDIELKVVGAERMTLNLLAAFPPKRGYIISSFVPEVLEAIYAMKNDVPLALICENRKQLEAAAALPLFGVVLHASLVHGEVIDCFLECNVPLFVWGAKRNAQMRSIVEAGAHALIVDDTKLAVQTFRSEAHTAGNP